MMHNDTIYIIDDNKDRSNKLYTVFNFIGKNFKLFSFAELQKNSASPPQILILAAGISLVETLNQLNSLHSLFPQTPFILVDLTLTPAQCLEYNVISCMSFPFTYNQLQEVFHRCQTADATIKSFDRHAHKTLLLRNLVGNSASMCAIRKLIEQVADTDASVLVLGESGTGKEVVARTIHALSSRAAKPFIPINCGAIPGELLESELFGHEKGAFTGAISSRQGRFELAHGGTLFLDEIGDMPLAMQVKLLRVLQEHSFERVGSNKNISVNVRIIAATHRNLEQAIAAGTFREDLFYRLNVFPIEMPALRERRDDVALLFSELMARCEQENRPTVQLLPGALESLVHYDWPGNVRELANLVERLSILFPYGFVNKQDLPQRFQGELSSEMNELGASLSERSALLDLVPEPLNCNEGIDLKEHLVKTELTLITQALEEADWVVAHAASYLNMRRTTLVEKMRKYGLTRPEKIEH